MRTTDTPYITDWFAVSIRWLFLVGLVISLALGGNFLVLPNILLVGLACWNIFLTLLTGLNRRLAFHREIGLGVDIVIATAYFGLTGGYTNPAFWIVFLPLITSALYFELTGALISAIFMTVVQLGVTVSQTLSPIPLIILGVFSLFTFLIAGVFW